MWAYEIGKRRERSNASPGDPLKIDPKVGSPGVFTLEEQEKMGLANGREETGQFPGVERRKHPRYLIEIPLDYTDGRTNTISTGLTANASEGGLMTFLGERVEVGAILDVTLLFRLGFSFTSMETRSMVVWRDDIWKEYIDNYRYGLKFLEPESKELEKLRKLFESSERQETLYIPARPRM